jgi:hypothetical protein
MAKAIFYVNGVASFSAVCGQSLALDIPGYSQVWLTQYQNGGLQYDGPYQLPSAPYLLSCQRDVGTYQGSAYQIVNGQKGQLLDSWTFVVNNAAATQGTPTQTGAGVSTGLCLSGLCSPSAAPPTQAVSSGAPGPGGTTSVIVTGGPGQYVAPPQPGITGQALNPNGDLPGIGQTVSATAGGSPQTTGAPTASPGMTTGTFNFSAFVKSPLFLLLVALVVLIYFLTQKKGG